MENMLELVDLLPPFVLTSPSLGAIRILIDLVKSHLLVHYPQIS